MEKAKKIIQWIVGAVLATLALFGGSVGSAMLFGLAALLIMPIAPIRNFIKNKMKVKNWLIILLVVVFFISGLVALPGAEGTETEGTGIETEEGLTSENSSQVSFETDGEESQSQNQSEQSSASQSSASSSASSSHASSSASASASTRPSASASSSASASTKPSASASQSSSVSQSASTSTPSSGTTMTQIVYVTETGKKYHSKRDCTGLNNAKAIYEISIADIGSRTACKTCCK